VPQVSTAWVAVTTPVIAAHQQLCMWACATRNLSQRRQLLSS